MIHVTLSGQWEMSTVADYRRDVEDALQSLSRGMSGLRILIDATEQGVQPKDVSEAIAAMVADFARLDHATAVVLPASVLKGMQAKRIGLPLTRNRFFVDLDEALAWLLIQEVMSRR
jgi:hypothetical protein